MKKNDSSDLEAMLRRSRELIEESHKLAQQTKKLSQQTQMFLEQFSDDPKKPLRKLGSS